MTTNIYVPTCYRILTCHEQHRNAVMCCIVTSCMSFQSSLKLMLCPCLYTMPTLNKGYLLISIIYVLKNVES